MQRDVFRITIKVVPVLIVLLELCFPEISFVFLCFAVSFLGTGEQKNYF